MTRAIRTIRSNIFMPIVDNTTRANPSRRDGRVTRDEMAALFARELGYPDTGRNHI